MGVHGQEPRTRWRAHRRTHGDAQAHRLALAVAALCALSLPTAACPSCSVGQAVETLAMVMAFMTIPYLVVSGVWLWVRSILSREDGTKPPV